MQDEQKDVLRVLAVQSEVAKKVQDETTRSEHQLDSAIEKAERVLQERGIPLPQHLSATPLISNTSQMAPLRPWDKLVSEAKSVCQEEVSLEDLLSADEIKLINSRLDRWGEEFYNLHRLTQYDYAVAATAGILAGLADIFLVKVPAHPGFLGGPKSEGGWLSNKVKDLFGDILPEEKINALEKIYKVPYDSSTNKNLNVKISNLSPRSHRLHSLGHDPILGWIVGVWDILNGSMTTIGGDGRLITQTVEGNIPVELGWDIFAKIAEALKKVGGHLASDVATPAGLPPPLFVLLQFLQVGNIKGRTIAELARAMYRSGYDFRHFLAGGVCVALIEAIVRIAYFAREIHEGKRFQEAVPVGNLPRLRTGLLLAHSTAAAINAGKIAVTQNPLAMNWAQWLAFFRYLLPQLHWTLMGKEKACRRFIDERLDEGWDKIETELSKHFLLQNTDNFRL